MELLEEIDAFLKGETSGLSPEGREFIKRLPFPFSITQHRKQWDQELLTPNEKDKS